MSQQPTKELHGLALDARMPKVGQLVARRYEVHEVLGVGGFAVVYRARDTKLGGEVALKVLEPEKSGSEEFVTRFQQEINLVRQLRHHNTIKIWDAGLTDTSCLYMASELVDGEELSDLIARTNGVGVARTKRIVTQVLRSLAEAHKNGIVHRDLKPSNIMVAQLEGEADYVKVVDFGIAKALTPSLSMIKTQTGLVMCTPAYASPEVLRNQNISPASDLYALGLIMIELLTGAQAVQGESQVDIMVKQINPAPIELLPGLAHTPIGQVVARAVAKQAEHRYQSAAEMLQDLERVPNHEVNVQAPPGPRPTGPVASPPSTPTAGPPRYPQVPEPAYTSPPFKGSGTASGPVQPPAAGLHSAPTAYAPGPPAGHPPASQQLPRSSGQGPSHAPPSYPPAAATGQRSGAKVAWIVALLALLVAGGLAIVLLTRGDSESGDEPVVETDAGEPSEADAGPSTTPDAGTASADRGATPQGPTDPMAVTTPPTIDAGGLPRAPDAGQVVAVAPDTGQVVAVAPDAGQVVAVAPDAGQVVAVAPDAGQVVAVPPDAGQVVAVPPDAGQVVAVAPDAGHVPTLLPDAGQTVVVAPDAGQVVPVVPDAGAPIDLPDAAVPIIAGALTSAADPTLAVGPVTYEIAGEPGSVRLYWRYADDEEADWSDRIRCNRPCSLEVPEPRPVEVRLRKTDHCTEEWVLEPDPTHGPWELSLEEGCGSRSSTTTAPIICQNTCQWAYDGECDDGGPNSLYDLCPLGSDCADCGPRSLGR